MSLSLVFFWLDVLHQQWRSGMNSTVCWLYWELPFFFSCVCRSVFSFLSSICVCVYCLLFARRSPLSLSSALAHTHTHGIYTCSRTCWHTQSPNQYWLPWHLSLLFPSSHTNITHPTRIRCVAVLCCIAFLRHDATFLSYHPVDFEWDDLTNRRSRHRRRSCSCCRSHRWFKSQFLYPLFFCSIWLVYTPSLPYIVG